MTDEIDPPAMAGWHSKRTPLKIEDSSEGRFRMIADGPTVDIPASGPKPCPPNSGVPGYLYSPVFGYIPVVDAAPEGESTIAADTVVPEIRIPSDAEILLRAMLESGCEHYAGVCDDRECFHCGGDLDGDDPPHREACPYVAARTFIARIDKDKE